MTEAITVATWTLVRKIDVPNDVRDLFVAGESATVAYTTARDYAVFTNKRLIIVDIQGLTGKRVKIYSLPYSAINMWSSENAGHIDFNAEVDLWTRAGHVKIKLKRGIDIREIDRLISAAVLH